MKKIIIALAAFAAVSTAAIAERSTDLRSSDTYFGKFAEPSSVKRLDPGFSPGVTTDFAPLAVDQPESTAGDSEIPGLGNQGDQTVN